MLNWEEIKDAMLSYDEDAAVTLLENSASLSHVDILCRFLERNFEFGKQCGRICSPDCYEDDDEMIAFCEGCPSWDYAVDILAFLASKFDVGEKDDNGDWKTGDIVLEEIKEQLEKQMRY